MKHLHILLILFILSNGEASLRLVISAGNAALSRGIPTPVTGRTRVP